MDWEEMQPGDVQMCVYDADGKPHWVKDPNGAEFLKQVEAQWKLDGSTWGEDDAD